jgi:hypothetical protein
MGSRSVGLGGGAVRRPKSPFAAAGDIALHSFEVSRSEHVQPRVRAVLQLIHASRHRRFRCAELVRFVQ